MSSDDVKPLTVAKPKTIESTLQRKQATAYHVPSSEVPQHFRSTLLPQGLVSQQGSDTRSDEGETIIPSPPTINIPQSSRMLRDQEESFHHLTQQEKFDYEQELRAGIAEMARNRRLEIIMPPPGTPLSSVKHTFDLWRPIAEGESSLSIGRLVLRGIFMVIDHLLKVYNIDVPNFLEIQMASISDYDSIIYSLAQQFTGENGATFSPMTKLVILLAINVFAVVAPTFLRGTRIEQSQTMGVADFVKKQLGVVPEKRQSPVALERRPTVPKVGGGMIGDLMGLIPNDPETIKKALGTIASMVATQHH